MKSAFFVIKPEGLVCCPQLLQRHLEKAGFIIEREYEINHWEVLAQRLYPTPETQKILAYHLDAFRHLFPEKYNSAMLIDTHHRSEQDMLQLFTILNQLKKSFRSQLEPSSKVGIFRKTSSSALGEEIFLTYLHVPDANIQTILQERILIEEFICS